MKKEYNNPITLETFVETTTFLMYSASGTVGDEQGDGQASEGGFTPPTCPRHL